MASLPVTSIAIPLHEAPRPRVAVAVQSKFYHPELDSLRWWGFLAIFTAHISPWTETLYRSMGLSERAIGVVLAAKRAAGFDLDMFFVLSAYLITTLLLREIDTTKRLDVRSFYLRRVLRIWPLYFTFVSLICIAAIFHNSMRPQWYYLAAFYVLLGNFVPALGVFKPLPLGPLWSISVEEQFYLLWPLVVRRLSRRGLIGLAVGLVAESVLARLILASYHVEYSAIWCSTFTRLDPFAGGIMLAVGLKGRSPNLSAVARLAIFLGGIGAWFCAGYWFPFMPGRVGILNASLAYPLGALGSCAVVVSALRARPIGTRLLIGTTFTYLGKISYGLYVFHLLFVDLSFRVFQIVTGWSAAPQDAALSYAVCYAVALTATIGCAMASYRWLETPFLRLKERISHVASRPV